MKRKICTKSIVIGCIVLFFGASNVPDIAGLNTNSSGIIPLYDSIECTLDNIEKNHLDLIDSKIFTVDINDYNKEYLDYNKLEYPLIFTEPSLKQVRFEGKSYTDLMKCVDYAINNFSFIDKTKIAAAGASYGGYMVNWIEGHSDRFKCLISHDGIFNLTSFYFATEELWFPEWEFKGTPWTNKEMYEKFSPHNYVQNFKTPMLVIHGQQDFRVPVGEGFQLFTALQKMNVPSKFIYFPNEGHFVTRPLNSELWYNNIHEWLEKYLK